MGKNKKKKEKKKGLAKEVKSKANVDERVKQVNAIQPPDQNPFKMENEKRIDSFLRFGSRGKDEKMRLTIRQIKKLKH